MSRPLIKPKPGTIGLSMIGGTVGKLINVGQALHGDPSGWTHAFVVVDETRVLEAQQPVSRFGYLDFYMRPGNAIFLPGWPDVRHISPDKMLEIAVGLQGIPYSYLDYASLAFHGWGIDLPMTRKRITDTGHMICSQLVDEFFRRLGVQLFDDGRLPMDVTPGDLHIQWSKALSLALLNGTVGITYAPTDNTPLNTVSPTSSK
jgi:hypothetical protein